MIAIGVKIYGPDSYQSRLRDLGFNPGVNIELM
jgi:Fe2+ transport system protein FeoA